MGALPHQRIDLNADAGRRIQRALPAFDRPRRASAQALTSDADAGDLHRHDGAEATATASWA